MKTTVMNITAKRVPGTVKLGYSMGNLGFGVVYQSVVSYLVFYSTAILLLPGAVVGLMISFGVVWDAITDPLMGFVSDNTVSKRFGKRHLYLLIGGVGIAAMSCFLWSGDQSAPYPAKAALVFICLILIKTFMTVYGTPYTALGAELSDDYDERSSIQGLRTALFLAGIMVALFVFMLVFFKSTPEYPQGQLNPSAYPRMGITVSVIMLAACCISYISTRRYIVHGTGVPAHSGGLSGSLRLFLTQCLAALKNKELMRVVLGYLCTNIATAVASSIGLHVYTYVFGLTSIAIAVLFGCQFLFAIVSQPVWILISKRIDKKPSVMIGLLACIICSIVFIFLVLFRDGIPNPFVSLVIVSGVLGFGTGGLFSLPLSMIADTVDLEEYKTGIKTAGLFYGLQTFSYKISQSLVILILGLAIQALGFDATLLQQTEYTKTGLGMTLAIMSMLSFALAMLAYRKYGLSKDKVLEIQGKLRRF